MCQCKHKVVRNLEGVVPHPCLTKQPCDVRPHRPVVHGM